MRDARTTPPRRWQGRPIAFEKRLELLRHVATHTGLNVRQLAKSLQRDYKNVHTDVSSLLELGLLDRGKNGTLSTPYDEIVIHAGIRDAA